MLRLKMRKRGTNSNNKIYHYFDIEEFNNDLIQEYLGTSLFHYKQGRDEDLAETLKDYGLNDESGWYLLFECLSQKLCDYDESEKNALDKAIEITQIYKKNFHYIYDVDRDGFIFVDRKDKSELESLKEYLREE